jgi:hypothetical protein
LLGLAVAVFIGDPVILSDAKKTQHAQWNCRHAVGGETWDDVELCERFVLGSSSNRASFSPSAFQLGEKVPTGG